MKLWLDDVRPAPEGWVWARCVAEARDAVLFSGAAFKSSVIWEEASLDHDLGEFMETGVAFVYWMVDNDLWPRIKPRVHSMNPYGRCVMEQVIDRWWTSQD